MHAAPAPVADIAMLKKRLRALTAGPQRRQAAARVKVGPTPVDAKLGGGLARHALHEICGPGGVFFAAALAGRGGRTLAWIAHDDGECRLFPQGGGTLGLAPDALLCVTAPARETLWAVEQTLRSGAVDAVVVETPEPPDFTASRRLQLAARDAGAFAVLLVPDRRRRPAASAAETRWRAAPLPAGEGGVPRYGLELLKNKSGPLGAWEVIWDETTHRFRLAAPV